MPGGRFRDCLGGCAACGLLRAIFPRAFDRSRTLDSARVYLLHAYNIFKYRFLRFAALGYIDHPKIEEPKNVRL